MPNTKQFEALDLSNFGLFNPIKKMSMIEISELFHNNIQSVYSYLLEGKNVSIEVPNHECFYRIKMKDSNNFRIYKQNGEMSLVEKKKGIEFVNWLFAIAPFISIICIQNK